MQTPPPQKKKTHTKKQQQHSNNWKTGMETHNESTFITFKDIYGLLHLEIKYITPSVTSPMRLYVDSFKSRTGSLLRL